MSELELKAEIDDLTEQLSECRQTIDGHNSELQGREDIGYEKAMLEMEGKIESAFYGGWKACSKRDSTPLRALLNYNMEQKL